MNDERLAGKRRRENLERAVRVIRPYLDDHSIVEITMNPDGWVWIERRRQRMERTEVRFDPDEAEVMLRFIAAAVLREGDKKTFDEDSPSLACKLPEPWFHRVQGVLPPWSDAPAFSLRAPARQVFPLESYVENRVLTLRQFEALRAAVLEPCNILVAGATGTGKTTFVNALLRVVAEHTADRLLLIEDEQELQCQAAQVTHLRVSPPRRTIQEAVQISMRLRPDRIIVGEVRDKAARGMLEAWRTGHRGGIATVHADDGEGPLERLVELMEQDGAPVRRASVAATVNVVVHLVRDASSSAGCKVSGMHRVSGWTPEAGWLTQLVDA